MKTKISVDIHKFGEHTEQILKIVATNNAGLREVSMGELINYLAVRDALYPTTVNDLGYIKDLFPEAVLLVSNDKGKTYSLTLTWKEVIELEPHEADLLTQENLS